MPALDRKCKLPHTSRHALPWLSDARLGHLTFRRRSPVCPAPPLPAKFPAIPFMIHPSLAGDLMTSPDPAQPALGLLPTDALIYKGKRVDFALRTVVSS